jgi:hypothetical protein
MDVVGRRERLLMAHHQANPPPAPAWTAISRRILNDFIANPSAVGPATRGGPQSRMVVSQRGPQGPIGPPISAGNRPASPIRIRYAATMQEPDSEFLQAWQCLAMRRVSRRMWAVRRKAVAEAMVFSQSLASLRHRPSQAKVRSTTHRRGRTAKPWAVSERLMISRIHRPLSASAAWSLSPA